MLELFLDFFWPESFVNTPCWEAGGVWLPGGRAAAEGVAGLDRVEAEAWVRQLRRLCAWS